MTYNKEESEHYGPGTICSHCGELIEPYAPDWAEMCLEHSNWGVAYYEEKMRELIEQWRDDALAADVWEVEQCCLDKADELEEKLNDSY